MCLQCTAALSTFNSSLTVNRYSNKPPSCSDPSRPWARSRARGGGLIGWSICGTFLSVWLQSLHAVLVQISLRNVAFARTHVVSHFLIFTDSVSWVSEWFNTCTSGTVNWQVFVNCCRHPLQQNLHSHRGIDFRSCYSGHCSGVLLEMMIFFQLKRIIFREFF